LTSDFWPKSASSAKTVFNLFRTFFDDHQTIGRHHKQVEIFPKRSSTIVNRPKIGRHNIEIFLGMSIGGAVFAPRGQPAGQIRHRPGRTWGTDMRPHSRQFGSEIKVNQAPEFARSHTDSSP
jgi:hypothetical protein